MDAVAVSKSSGERDGENYVEKMNDDGEATPGADRREIEIGVGPVEGSESGHDHDQENQELSILASVQDQKSPKEKVFVNDFWLGLKFLFANVPMFSFSSIVNF